jgi:hypothetical protein
MKYNVLCLFIVTIVMTMGMVTGFSPLSEAFATEVHSKDSLTVFCGAKIGISYDAIKLKPGDSKKVGCSVNPDDVDIDLVQWGSCTHSGCQWMQVFWCNHKNPFEVPKEKLLHSGDITDVKCVEP